MKITHESGITTTGTINAAQHQMGFDADGTAMLMRILSGLYADARKAVLQEYACNARDSHIASGTRRPVQVTLPSDIEPTLVVEDRGIGLSRDEIVGTYAVYGRSTKRDDNDQIGAFGIGAKSAFAVSPTFTVTGVKHGRTTTAVFSLDGEGIGQVSFPVDDQPTTSPNGVTVQVPFTDVSGMDDIAARVFALWPTGSVQVNGDEHVSVLDGGLPLGDEFTVPDRAATWPWRGRVVVRMGAVTYPLRDEQIALFAKPLQEAGFARDARLVVNAELGALQPAPSRETLASLSRFLCK